jgi:hypothetical protein
MRAQVVAGILGSVLGGVLLDRTGGATGRTQVAAGFR